MFLVSIMLIANSLTPRNEFHNLLIKVRLTQNQSQLIYNKEPPTCLTEPRASMSEHMNPKTKIPKCIANLKRAGDISTHFCQLFSIELFF